MSCRDIQVALFRRFNRSGAIIAFNTQNVLCHEADVMVLRKSGVTLEIEVKVSRSDFRADFRKVEKHKQMAKGHRYGPQYFYYACEPGIIEAKDVPAYAGLLHIALFPKVRGRSGGYILTEVKKAPRLHKHINKGIHERICRSLMHRALPQ